MWIRSRYSGRVMYKCDLGGCKRRAAPIAESKPVRGRGRSTAAPGLARRTRAPSAAR